MKKHPCPKKLSILLILMVLVLSACSGIKEPAAIKVVFLPYLSNAPFFIAKEEGFFEEQGLTIELVEMARSSEAIPAIEGGDVDVVGGGLSAGLLNAIHRGANIKLVADKGRMGTDGCATTLLMASNSFLEAHPSKSPADLEGAKIGVNPAGFTGYFAEKYLNQANLTLDDINLFKGKAAEQFEAISDGSLDIMGASEPWATRVMQAGYGSIWVTANDIIPGASYAMVWYGPSLLGKDSDVGQRFMVAYLQGVRQFNQGKTDRNIEILAKYTELEPDLVSDACWVEIQDDGKITVSDVDDFQEWALGKELLDEIISEEMFWDSSFIDYAVKELGD
jgi:NitT/TauT family transport system substrate-binding protein